MSMEFWRVENRAGWGPYSQRAPYIPTQKTHLLPQDDGLKKRWFKSFRDVFGFKSRELLEQWFDQPTVVLLHEHGYVVSLYQVSRFRMKSGGTQSFANRAKLTLVARYSCVDLDEQIDR